MTVYMVWESRVLGGGGGYGVEWSGADGGSYRSGVQVIGVFLAWMGIYK